MIFFRKDKLHSRYVVMGSIILLLFCYGYFEWTRGYFATGFDSYFHLQRIYEIREAFLHNEIPGWLNFVTFHHLGQAINGMYPEISLWPLIYITSRFDPIHQVLVIKIFLMLLTFYVSYFSLASRFDRDNSALIAGCYTFSGLVLRSFYLELQLGTALALAVLFPIIFNYMELVRKRNLDIKLILKTGLLGWIVLNSHLMSAFVLYLTLVIFLIPVIVTKRNYIALVNVTLSGILLFVTSLPMLYRYYVLSRAKLAPPFSEGNVTADNVMQTVTNASIDARVSFTTVALIALVLVIGNIRSDKINKLLPYIYVELFIVVMGTSIAPWELLEKLPFLKNFQNAGWRFMIFASAIPFILLLINFSDSMAKKISTILLMITLISAVSVISSYLSTSKDWIELSDKTVNYLGNDDWTKITATGINSDKITRNIVPDYAPAEIRTTDANGGVLVDDIQQKIMNNAVELNGKIKRSTLSYAPGEVIFKLKDISSGKLVLPIWGYKTLNYRITDGTQKLSYHINKDGWLTLTVKKTPSMKIKVKYTYPRMYVYYLLISALFLLGSILSLSFIKYREYVSHETVE